MNRNLSTLGAQGPRWVDEMKDCKAAARSQEGLGAEIVPFEFQNQAARWRLGFEVGCCQDELVFPPSPALEGCAPELSVGGSPSGHAS